MSKKCCQIFKRFKNNNCPSKGIKKKHGERKSLYDELLLFFFVVALRAGLMTSESRSFKLMMFLATNIEVR